MKRQSLGTRWWTMVAGLAALAMTIFPSAKPLKAAELVMFDQVGCYYCDLWDEEIGSVYPKTEEAVRAPLRRVNLHDTRPSDLAFIRGVRFTPTFVLVEDGAEIGRIEGYPGDMFFWGLLNRMIQDLPKGADG